MWKEVPEGDYLLQFAFINYGRPHMFFPKFQARDRNAKKQKNFFLIKIKIFYHGTSLWYIRYQIQRGEY